MKMLSIIFTLTAAFALTLQAKNADMQTFTLTDTSGKTYTVHGTQNGFRLEGAEDKVVFLEFFGYRCPPCLATIPHLIELQEKYKDKLAVLAIEVQGLSDAQLKDFIKEKKINYIAVADGKDGGFIDYIAQRAQWQGSIPFLVAVDTKQEVRFVQVGLIPQKSLESLVEKLYIPKGQTPTTNENNVSAKPATPVAPSNTPSAAQAPVPPPTPATAPAR